MLEVNLEEVVAVELVQQTQRLLYKVSPPEDAGDILLEHDICTDLHDMFIRITTRDSEIRRF